MAGDGFDSPFEQLVACIISIRTRDEVTLPTARRFFDRARTPEAVAMLPIEELAELIQDSAFSERKAEQIHALAREVLADHEGHVPCDGDSLMSFKGVGVKCANLVLSIACDQPKISVDVHVHRITNRWGYVETNRPEQTVVALEEKLPLQFWIDINRLLVPFGKHVCTGRRPRCSVCPVLEMCQQVGVEEPR